MKRASAAVAMLALTLAGCGGGSGTTTSQITTVPKAPTTTGPANPPPSTVTTNPSPKPPAPKKQTTTAKSLNPASPPKTVTYALSLRDQIVCGLYTKQLLNRSFGGMQGCRSAVSSGGRASSVEIVKTKTKGNSATVIAVPHGGPSSAEKLTISLVRTEGRWQLRAIKSNTPVGP